MSVHARVGYDETCVFPRGFDVRVSTRDGQVVVRVELHGSARSETMPLEPHEARVVAGLLRRATEGFDETAPTVREAARRRMPLDGSDAQALEGALAMTESDRDALRARLEEREADIHARIRAGYDATIADCWRAAIAKVEAERDRLRRELEALREDVRTGTRHQTALAFAVDTTRRIDAILRGES